MPLSIDSLERDLRAIPNLTETARDMLLALAKSGREVYTYPAGGDPVIWIRAIRPDFEARWSPLAWDLYCRGIHSADVTCLCQCVPCQMARQEEARRHFAEMQQRGPHDAA
jgi:hypothetical protein